MTAPILIDFGATIRADIELRDNAMTGTPLFDPTVVAFIFYKPDGTTLTLTYGVDGAVGRTSVGKYYCEITGDQSGPWTYVVSTTGPANGKDDGAFTVGLNPAL